MNKLEKDTLALIKTSNGIKAKEIAKKLNVERSQINSLLYGSLHTHCYQDAGYRWFLKRNDNSDSKDSQNKINSSDKELEKVCKYYLNCLSLDGNNGISAFLTSKFDLNYIEIDHLEIKPTNVEITQFLKRIGAKKSMTTYMGYPTMIEKIYSSRTQQSYLKIAPVFLFAIDISAGRAQVNLLPSINIEAIKQYSSKDINTQIYDLIDLESELGLNDPTTEIELDELVARLQTIRKWEWMDKLDPNNIHIDKPINELINEGIYNRAILIATDSSPYTQGLESELSELASMEENQYKETALHKWIHRPDETLSATHSHEKDTCILEVLPLNIEQDTATNQALYSDLTIVTGPPGTGKSQIVTNILINTAWQGKNVLFASKNNKAVDVVYDRVNNLGKRPIMLRIGGNQYASHLAELINNLLSVNADISNREEYEYHEKAYKAKILLQSELKKKKDRYISLRNQVDHIEQKVCQIKNHLREFYGKINEKDVSILNSALNDFVTSYIGAQKEKQNLIYKMFWKFICAKRNEVVQKKTDALNNNLQQYDLQSIEISLIDLSESTLKKTCSDIQNYINDMKILIEYENLLSQLEMTDSIEDIDKKLFELKKDLFMIASELWNNWLVTRPLNIPPQRRIQMNQYVTAMNLVNDVNLSNHPDLKRTFNKLQKDMTNFLPCWAVTSLSAKSRIPFLPGIFDLLIIDEASQCDIASVLPLLYRAKRAVIIGDPKQLSHITSISKVQDFSLLQKYEVGFEWSYSTNSLYALASSIAGPNEIIQLRDHHRSYKDIIEFSNQEFYDGKLRIATNYDRLNYPKNTSAGIRWINIHGQTIRPSSGSAYNNREIQAVIDELTRLTVDNEYCGSIGVVTPFRAQANKIRESIEQNKILRNSLYTQNDFLVDTIHKFQGDEKDIMLFSPVISKGTQNGTINFLANTGNLFNVAITRAKSMLIVVGDMDYCSSCNVSYMEHFVDYVKKLDIPETITTQKQPLQQNSEYPKVANEDQVSEWEKIFYTALYNESIFTSPQYSVDKYKLDLALFQAERKLDIEIDGEMYHRDWNGELCYRDQLRNQRLYELGWDVKRFWVYQIRDELPKCIAQIKEWINT